MKLGRYAGKSDPGRKRRRNEDSFVCEPPLFAVADGMGGAQAGEVASQLAAAALREGNGEDAGERSVVELIQEANRRVWQRANEDAAASGMGTTITVAVVEPTRVVFGHVGDSRAYLLREGELIQLTEDHSLVAELVRRGELSPQEAETHPQRSVITRALGTDPDVDVDTFAVETKPGDLFLICSDGLSSMVGDEAVGDVIGRNRGDLDAAAKALVGEANRGGGEDNITAVLFEIAGDDEVGADTLPMAAVADPGPEPPHDRDEDTLDGVAAPAAADVPPPVDTMIVSPDDAAQLRATVAPAAGPSLARRALVLLVIVTLVLIIAALVLWGLAR